MEVLQNPQRLWGQWGELLKHLIEQLGKQERLVDFLVEGRLWELPAPFVNGILAFVSPDSLVESKFAPEDSLAFQKSIGAAQAALKDFE